MCIGPIRYLMRLFIAGGKTFLSDKETVKDAAKYGWPKNVTGKTNNS